MLQIIIIVITEQKHHYILQQKRNGGSITGPQSVVSFYLGLFSFILLFNKGKLWLLSAWWPLNRGDNNGKIIVTKAKRWPRSLNRGGRSIEVYFPILFFNYFRALITDRLMEDGCLIVGHLMEVQLYTELDDNHVWVINKWKGWEEIPHDHEKILCYLKDHRQHGQRDTLTKVSWRLTTYRNIIHFLGKGTLEF